MAIEKGKPAKKALDFSSLKQEGIEWIEKLSGKRWTDFNQHDPGITILEQLVYALTELAYRANYPVKDLLAQPKELVRRPADTLLEAFQVMPSAPSSLDDFRKLVIDTVGVRNAWVEPLPQSSLYQQPIRGLYRVEVIPEEISLDQSPPPGWPQLREELYEKLMANRNLCEDFVEIRCLRPRAFLFYNTELILDAHADQEEIMAEVFYQLDQYLRQSYQVHSLFDLQNNGLTLPEIFDGPPVQYGFIRSNELQERLHSVRYSKLLEIISGVEGIQGVYRMEVKSDGARRDRYELFLNDDEYPTILLPTENPQDLGAKDHDGIVVYKSGQPVRLDHKELRRLFYVKRATKERAYNVEVGQHVESRKEQGQHKSLSKYYSIQHQFPKTYGLTQGGEQMGSNMVQGFSERMDSRERFALIRQLKGYLAVFEQFLANYLAQLDHSKDLLSAGSHLGGSLFVQSLEQSIPYLSPLLVSSLGQSDAPAGQSEYYQNLQQITARHDNWQTRRQRFLDHLLARFGESFPQVDSNRFNYYLSEAEYSYSVVQAKSQFLTDYVAISRDRSKGINYRKNTWNAPSFTGLERRVQLYLALLNGKLEFNQNRESLAGAVAGLRIESGNPDDDSQDQFEHIEFEPELIDADFHYLVETEETLAQARKAITGNESALSGRKRYLQSLENTHERTLKHIREKQKALRELDKQLRDAQKEQERSRREVKKESKEFDKSEQQLERINKELQANNDLLKALQEEESHMANQQQRSEQQQEDAHRHTSDAEALLQEATEEYKTWEKNLVSLSDELLAMEQEINKVQQVIQKLKTDPATKKKELQEQRKALRKLERKKEELEAKVKKNNSKATDADRHVRKAEERMTKANEALLKAVNQVNDTSSEWQSIKRRLQETLAENQALQKELVALGRELKQNRKDISHTEAEEIDAQELINQLEAKKRLLSYELEELLEQTTFGRKKRTDLQERVKELEKEHERLVSQHELTGDWPQPDHDFDRDRIINNDFIDSSLLRYGFNAENYMIGRGEVSEGYQVNPNHFAVIFYNEDSGRWRLLSEHPGKSRAVSFVHWLMGYLRSLNMESEGFHMVEHLLLRPIGERGETSYSYEHQNKDALLLYDPNQNLLLRSYKRYESKYQLERAKQDILFFGAGLIFHHYEQDSQGRYYLELHDRHNNVLAVAPHRFENLHQIIRFSKYLFDTCIAYEQQGQHAFDHFRHDTQDTFVRHELPPKFFSFTVSIFYPSWPARFQNAEFVEILRKTIRREVPAHVHIHFIPMGVHEMKEFEDAYSDWLHARSKEVPVTRNINGKAKVLAGIIARHIKASSSQPA